MSLGTPIKLPGAVREITSDEDPSIRWEISEETHRAIREIEDAQRQAAASAWVRNMLFR
jgi:hypothetical protein